MPDACGSTSPSTVCAVINASAAVPPARSTAHAAFVATGFAVATAYVFVRTGVIPDRYPVEISGLVLMSCVLPPVAPGVAATGVPFGTVSQTPPAVSSSEEQAVTVPSVSSIAAATPVQVRRARLMLGL
ncbi:hypothetical protein GCM10023319_14480 [Nocardia iowensis]